MKYCSIFVLVLLFSGAALAQEKTSEPVKEEPIPGFFRFDSDNYGLQLWASATHKLGPVSIATDIYVTSGSIAAFDIGPSFTFGPLTTAPMVGLGFDWGQKRMANIVPQLFSFIDIGPIYFESWFQCYLNSPLATGANNDLYTRDFLLLKLGSVVAIGPQVEATIALNNGRHPIMYSIPVGGHMNLKYGPADRLELFLGYETRKYARQVDTGRVDAAGLPVIAERGVAGRFTYVHSW